jgi:hypothetical protein
MSGGRGFHAFRASRPALARPERRASESDGLGAEAAARAARRAALKPYRKLITSGGWSRCVKIWAGAGLGGWGPLPRCGRGLILG